MVRTFPTISSTLIAMLALSCAAASAQDLVTDRPDFTESSEVVGHGIVQIESGFSYEHDGSGGDATRNIAVPASLVRLGLSRRVELRLSTDGFAVQRQGGARVSGMSDVEAGLKLRVFSEATAGFDMALIPMASFPTGSDGFSAGKVVPTLKLTWARSLPWGVGLSGNYNVSSEASGPTRFTQQALSLSAGHDLPRGFGAYLEAYGFMPMDRESGAGWTLDSGITRLVGESVQIDLEMGRGVTADAPDWFVGFGIALRGHFRPAH